MEMNAAYQKIGSTLLLKELEEKHLTALEDCLLFWAEEMHDKAAEDLYNKIFEKHLFD